MKMRKKQRSTPRVGCDLPEHLVISIYKYLPAKSLLRFCSVSKTFSSLIHKSSFVAAHLKHSYNNIFHPTKYQNALFFWVQRSNALRLTLYNETTNSPGPVYNFPGNYYVIGYCNGVVCLWEMVFDTNYFYFWNPLINKRVKNDLRKPFRSQALFLGFGYDASNNHFKLICVFKDEMSKVGARVYAVSGIGNSNKWRIYSINPPAQEFRALNNQCSSVYVSKVLHWLVIDCPSWFFPNSILSFHVEDEVFQKLALPGPLLPPDGETYFNPILTEFKGMLCVCSCQLYFNEPHTIWVMKVHGKADSWVPFLSIGLRSFQVLERKYNYNIRSLAMVGLKTNGKEFWVLRNRCSRLSLFNRKTLKLTDLERVPKRFRLFSITYTESLALMDVEDEECPTTLLTN